jgi:hypothetical protein
MKKSRKYLIWLLALEAGKSKTMASGICAASTQVRKQRANKCLQEALG